MHYRFVQPPIDWLNVLSSVGDFLTGLGTIILAYVGYRAGSEYRREHEIRKTISWHHALYPRDKMKGKDGSFYLARSPRSGDKVYLLDLKQKTSAWIKNPTTLGDLNFTFNDVEAISDSELDSFREVEPIDTKKKEGADRT